MDTFVLRTRGATFQTRARPPPHPHVHEPDLGHVALFAVSEEELLRSNAATRVNVHLNAISDPALHRWFHVCIHTVSSSSLQSKKHWLCSHTHTQAHTHTHTHTHTHKTCVGTHCPLTAPEAYASFHMCPCNCFNAVALRSLSICQSTDLTHASRTSLQHNNNQRKKKKTFPCVCVCVCVCGHVLEHQTETATCPQAVSPSLDTTLRGLQGSQLHLQPCLLCLQATGEKSTQQKHIKNTLKAKQSQATTKQNKRQTENVRCSEMKHTC